MNIFGKLVHMKLVNIFGKLVHILAWKLVTFFGKLVHIWLGNQVGAIVATGGLE